MHKSLGPKTIAMPLPAWVIGSFDAEGNANAMTASWAGIVNSDPPMVYFSSRESRYTYDCVIARKAFSINIAAAEHAAQVDYLGIVSGRGVDKLSQAGLTASSCQHVDAPFIMEFPLVLECRLSRTEKLGTHVMLLGEIIDVKCDEDMLTADGTPDTGRIGPFIYATGDSTYHAVSGLLGSGYELGVKLRGKSDK